MSKGNKSRRYYVKNGERYLIEIRFNGYCYVPLWGHQTYAMRYRKEIAEDVKARIADAYLEEAKEAENEK